MPVARTFVAQVERQIARCAVDCLRAAKVSDEEILMHYTVPNPLDTAYEQEYFQAHGVPISAEAIKAHMRTLVMN